MEKTLTNLIIFLAICFIVYILFRNFNYKEGMTVTDTSGNSNSTVNGAAGNSTNYAASIKNSTIQLQDALLISKYRSNYETVILNMDDYVNNLMLSTVLSMDTKNPIQTLQAINELNKSKTSLNNIMKFIDSQ